ncbi:unnamed protein product, partial [Scytosiphon promiscuus]
QVKDFDASQYFTAKKSVRSNDRVTHFAVAATKLAIEDAGVDVEACGERCGVMVSKKDAAINSNPPSLLELG